LRGCVTGSYKSFDGSSSKEVAELSRVAINIKTKGK
jgi:hypothetical protein